MIDLIDTDLQSITPYKYSPHTKISSNNHKPHQFQHVQINPVHQVQQVQIDPVPLLLIVKATNNSAAITQIWTHVGVQTFWALIVRALNPSSCYDNKVRNQTRLFSWKSSKYKPTKSSHPSKASSKTLTSQPSKKPSSTLTSSPICDYLKTYFFGLNHQINQLQFLLHGQNYQKS